MTDNSYEYIIKQKNEGRTLIKKICAVVGYAVFAAVLSALSLIFSPPYVHLPLILLSIALTALLIFITWRFLCVEYEVFIGGRDITITAIYGKSFRKAVLNIDVNSFSEIGEYDCSAYEEISKLSLQKNYICLSSLSAPDVYYAIFDEDKDRCILYLDTPKRAAELLKKINPGAFRASDARMNKNQRKE